MLERLRVLERKMGLVLTLVCTLPTLPDVRVFLLCATIVQGVCLGCYERPVVFGTPTGR